MLVIDIMTGKGGEEMTDSTIITGDGKRKSYHIEYGKHDIFIQVVLKK